MNKSLLQSLREHVERSEIGGQNFARRALECGGLAPLCRRNSRDSRPKKIHVVVHA